MLKETYSRKGADADGRRWFSDEYLDLIVWLDGPGSISGFQLCYDKNHSERALTWNRDRGFVHERVDDGESDPAKNSTPILIPDGVCPAQLVEAFIERSDGVEDGIRSFVTGKVREYISRTTDDPSTGP